MGAFLIRPHPRYDHSGQLHPTHAQREDRETCNDGSRARGAGANVEALEYFRRRALTC